MSTPRLTYPHRRRGLDHDWFPYAPTHRRPAVTWPNGKPIALWITVPLEFFPLDAPAQPFRPLGGLMLGYPDLWNYSSRDYGLRIGIYRIMNQKRAEVNAFIQKDLLDAVHAELSVFAANVSRSAEAELAALAKKVGEAFGSTAIEATGNIALPFQQVPDMDYEVRKPQVEIE